MGGRPDAINAKPEGLLYIGLQHCDSNCFEAYKITQSECCTAHFKHCESFFIHKKFCPPSCKDTLCMTHPYSIRTYFASKKDYLGYSISSAKVLKSTLVKLEKEEN